MGSNGHGYDVEDNIWMAHCGELWNKHHEDKLPLGHQRNYMIISRIDISLKSELNG